jgi:hypothetical protein
MGTAFPQPTLFFRKDVVSEWTTNREWHRLLWLYYADDRYGITLRLYDDEHFAHYATAGYYIEPPGRDSADDFERVIVRGYSMGEEIRAWEPGLRACRLMHSRSVLLRGDDPASDPLDLLRPDVTSLGRQATLKLRLRAASNWMIWKATEAPVSADGDDPVQNIYSPASSATRRGYFQHPDRNDPPEPMGFVEEV